MVEAAVFLVFPLCLAFAAFSDAMTMTIPNRASVVLACSFLVVAPFLGLAPAEIGMHLAGAAIVFAVCFGLFAMKVMGGGDAKLLSAAALWFGLNNSLFLFILYVAYAGGIVTLLILLLRSRSHAIMAMGVPVPNSLLVAKKIPYGIAIAIGGFLAYPSSTVVTVALGRIQ